MPSQKSPVIESIYFVRGVYNTSALAGQQSHGISAKLVELCRFLVIVIDKSVELDQRLTESIILRTNKPEKLVHAHKNLSRTVSEVMEAHMHGDETILLAEDDPIVRDATKAVLEFGGYKVITAENGREAVDRFKENRVDMVLMDVFMPVMNGFEAFRRIRETAPDVRILFTSGFTADIMDREGIAAREVRLLQKPVSSDTLLKMVRVTLDAP